MGVLSCTKNVVSEIKKAVSIVALFLESCCISRVVLWAMYFGATGLLFLPSKAMTAIFGAFAGISLSEISPGAGLIAAGVGAPFERGVRPQFYPARTLNRVDDQC